MKIEIVYFADKVTRKRLRHIAIGSFTHAFDDHRIRSCCRRRGTGGRAPMTRLLERIGRVFGHVVLIVLSWT